MNNIEQILSKSYKNFLFDIRTQFYYETEIPPDSNMSVYVYLI